jgi:hypothetical protein
MSNLREIMVVMAVSNVTLHLSWLQRLFFVRYVLRPKKHLSIENVMQQSVFSVRYKLRLKNQLSKEHIARPDVSTPMAEISGWFDVRIKKLPIKGSVE